VFLASSSDISLFQYVFFSSLQQQVGNETWKQFVLHGLQVFAQYGAAPDLDGLDARDSDSAALPLLHFLFVMAAKLSFGQLMQWGLENGYSKKKSAKGAKKLIKNAGVRGAVTGKSFVRWLQRVICKVFPALLRSYVMLCCVVLSIENFCGSYILIGENADRRRSG